MATLHLLNHGDACSDVYDVYGDAQEAYLVTMISLHRLVYGVTAGRLALTHSRTLFILFFLLVKEADQGQTRLMDKNSSSTGLIKDKVP